MRRVPYPSFFTDMVRSCEQGLQFCINLLTEMFTFIFVFKNSFRLRTFFWLYYNAT